MDFSIRMNRYGPFQKSLQGNTSDDIGAGIPFVANKNLDLPFTAPIYRDGRQADWLGKNSFESNRRNILNTLGRNHQSIAPKRAPVCRIEKKYLCQKNADNCTSKAKGAS